jgi:hypothetical protein
MVAEMKDKFPSRRLGIWPTLSLHIHFRKPAKGVPFPLNQDACRIYAKARHVPVEVADAPVFLERIRRHGIVGLLFWINPHPSLPVADFPRSRALRERMLALPVHQELTRSELRQIAAAVRHVYSEPLLTPAG